MSLDCDDEFGALQVGACEDQRVATSKIPFKNLSTVERFRIAEFSTAKDVKSPDMRALTMERFNVSRYCYDACRLFAIACNAARNNDETLPDHDTCIARAAKDERCAAYVAMFENLFKGKSEEAVFDAPKRENKDYFTSSTSIAVVDKDCDLVMREASRWARGVVGDGSEELKWAYIARYVLVVASDIDPRAPKLAEKISYAKLYKPLFSEMRERATRIFFIKSSCIAQPPYQRIT